MAPFHSSGEDINLLAVPVSSCGADKDGYGVYVDGTLPSELFTAVLPELGVDGELVKETDPEGIYMVEK
jgi:hypothetical protein